MNPTRSTIFFITILILSLSCFLGAQEPEPVYIFPVQFQSEVVPQQEQTMFSEVITEEMGSLFWMNIYTLDKITEEFDEKLADKINKCTSPVCALNALKKVGIKRTLFIRVTKIKRRVFEIHSALMIEKGKILYKYTEEEHGGQSELKYAAAGIVEQLFKKEIEAHANKITSIVETTAITSTDADTTITKADQLKADGNLDEALKQYRMAAKESPDLALPYIKIAEIEKSRDNAFGAENAIDQALKRENSNPQALILKAEILLERSNVGQAEQLLRAAIAKDNKQIKGYYLLGSLLADNNRHKEALEFLKSACVLAPEAPEPLVNLGKVYLELNNLKEALINFTKAVEINPNLLAVYPPLAEVYEAMKQYDNAARTYQALFDKMPDCAACAYNLARMKEQTKSFEEAKQAYEQTIELDESFLDAYYNLGELLVAMGKPKEAVNLFKQYVEMEDREDQQRYIQRAKKLIKLHSH